MGLGLKLLLVGLRAGELGLTLLLGGVEPKAGLCEGAGRACTAPTLPRPAAEKTMRRWGGRVER